MPDIAGLPSPVERAIANPPPQTGEDHEKRDLAAQEASALWAFWIVVASALSVLITAIGTRLLYQQIVLTREAVEDTGKATQAMVESNEIARRAAQSNRAWITYTRLSSGPARGVRVGAMLYRDGFIIAPEWTNSGFSPAINASCCNMIAVGAMDSEPPKFDFSAADRAARQTFGIGTPIRGKAVFLDDSQTALFRHRKLTVFLYSRVDYHDIYSPDTSPRFSEICLSVQYAQNDPNVPQPQLDIKVVGSQNTTT